MQPERRLSRSGSRHPVFRLWISDVASSGEQRRFALLGIRGQIILVDPASKLVMVHTAVRKKPSEPASNAEAVTLWLHVVAQLGKLIYPLIA